MCPECGNSLSQKNYCFVCEVVYDSDAIVEDTDPKEDKESPVTMDRYYHRILTTGIVSKYIL